MPNIHIERTHNLGLENARARAEQLMESLKNELQLDYEWSGNSLIFQRLGASGTAAVSADHLDLDIELDMVLFWLKESLEEKINKRLDAILR